MRRAGHPPRLAVAVAVVVAAFGALALTACSAGPSDSSTGQPATGAVSPAPSMPSTLTGGCPPGFVEAFAAALKVNPERAAEVQTGDLPISQISMANPCIIQVVVPWEAADENGTVTDWGVNNNYTVFATMDAAGAAAFDDSLVAAGYGDLETGLRLNADRSIGVGVEYPVTRDDLAELGITVPDDSFLSEDVGVVTIHEFTG